MTTINFKKKPESKWTRFGRKPTRYNQAFIFWRRGARRASEGEEACRKERKERKGRKGGKERKERKKKRRKEKKGKKKE